MARNFGIATGRKIVGGFDQSSGPHTRSSYAPRDLYSLPPLPARSILEPVEFSEPRVHKFQAFERALLFVCTAAALVVGVALLFVDIR